MEVINMLVASTTPKKVDAIARELGVSARTVQDDLKHIRLLQESAGFTLRTQRGQGVLLTVDDEAAFATFRESMARYAHQYAPSLEQRPYLLLLALAATPEHLTAEELARLVNTSRSSVFNALDKVEELAGANGLKLERARHRGFAITGNSFVRKRFLARALASETSWLYTSGRVNQELMATLTGIIKTLLNQRGIEVSYHDFMELLRFCAASCLLAQAPISQDDTPPAEKPAEVAALTQNAGDPAIFQAAGAASNMAPASGVAAPASAVANPASWQPKDANPQLIALVQDALTAMEAQLSVTFTAQDARDFCNEAALYVHYVARATLSPEELKEQLHAFFESHDAQYGTTYAQDASLEAMLVNHLALMLDRRARDLAYAAPSSTAFEATNLNEMNVAIALCRLVCEPFGVELTTDEVMMVAYHLAAHEERERQERLQAYQRIAVICSSGAGAATLAMLKIRGVFPQSQVATFSYLDSERVLAFDPELIVSMVDLAWEAPCPVVRVHELVDDADVARVRKAAAKPQLAPGVKKAQPLATLFDAAHVHHLATPPATYQELLSELAGALEAEGTAPAGYTQSVLARETFASTVYLEGICIAHPLEFTAAKDLVDVTILDEPLDHDGKPVRVVFLVCFTAASLPRLKTLAKVLYALMQDPPLAASINQNTSYSGLIKTISQLERSIS
jgi:lichenan operon transcriptional antiterminator